MRKIYLLILILIFILIGGFMLGGCESPSSGGGGGDAPLTSQVSFTKTAADSAKVYFDVDAWTVEEAAERWRIAVIEQGAVSFAVHKTAEQSIAAGGPDAAWVSQSREGEEADGSVAGPELALFTVDTARILDGGERAFNLTVSEAGKASRTVELGLEVEADLTQGVGVFFVEADGGLTRIRLENAESYANEYYLRDKEAGFDRTTSGSAKWCINFADVEDLFDALIWVDQYGKGGTAERFQEYRIRVEKDEAIIPTVLTGGYDNSRTQRAPYLRFSVWGYGEERTITRDTAVQSLQTKYSISSSSSNCLICVGDDYRDSDFPPTALSLGPNITIDAYREAADYHDYRGVIAVSSCGILTLEKGAKITNHIIGSYSAVRVFGLFEMRGGAITNCNPQNYAIFLGKEIVKNDSPVFRFYSGTLSGNGYNNLIYFAYGSVAAGGAAFPWTYFAVSE